MKTPAPDASAITSPTEGGTLTAPARPELIEAALREPRTHALKCWPEYFHDVRSGKKPFEIHQDDRGFMVGDILVLQEWVPEGRLTAPGYTGETHRVIVTYKTAFGQKADYCVLGIAATPSAVGAPVVEGLWDDIWRELQPFILKYGEARENYGRGIDHLEKVTTTFVTARLTTERLFNEHTPAPIPPAPDELAKLREWCLITFGTTHPDHAIPPVPVGVAEIEASIGNLIDTVEKYQRNEKPLGELQLAHNSLKGLITRFAGGKDGERWAKLRKHGALITDEWEYGDDLDRTIDNLPA